MAAAELTTMVRWPGDDSIMLVMCDGVHYNQAVRQTVAAMLQRFDHVVYICANRPSQLLRDNLRSSGIDTDRLHFVDCVTSMTGLAPPPAPGVTFVESPTMVEKVALRAEQLLRKVPGKKALLVDSLTSLAVYNGTNLVSELAHNMVTKLRMQQVGAALILVDQPSAQGLPDLIRPVCDGVLKMGN